MRAPARLGMLLFLIGQNVFAAAPTLFTQPAYESPVRGAPGDLLLLAGYAFSTTDTVVYQQISDTTRTLAPPAQVPHETTGACGTLTVVSSLDAPDSLTVSLPAAMQADASYAVWVLDDAGEWSNGILINDARPLWITPDTAYSSAQMASLPREIKVVGRNLQPAAGAVTQVRLSGPATFTLPAANDNDPTTAIENYVAKAQLPDNLPPGNYSVEVSRDGTSWTSLTQRQLAVLPDPMAPDTFGVDRYGCLPDDGVDDTRCIVAAIAAAQANGGGAVSFPAGVWDMNYAGARTNTGIVTTTRMVGVPVTFSRSAAITRTSSSRRILPPVPATTRVTAKQSRLTAAVSPSDWRRLRTQPTRRPIR
jgi:hypothetical protein